MSAVEAESGAEAIHIVETGAQFDVALIDYHMPEMDGVSVAREIRRKRSEDELALVFLPSVSRSDDQVKEAESLFQGILSKPLHHAQLQLVIGNVLNRQQQRQQPPSEAAAGRGIDSKLGELYPLRVLLAEDHLVNQKVAMRILRQMGYRADVANNGLEALETLRREDYDVILMDVQMPEMDGLEATGRIREEWDGRPQPVIVAMTANAMEGDRDRCLQAGMDLYLSKPIRINELEESLIKAHRMRRARREESET